MQALKVVDKLLELWSNSSCDNRPSSSLVNSSLDEENYDLAMDTTIRWA